MYLFFDTETTGLPKLYNAPITDTDNWPRLVQIAWSLHDKKGKELAKHESIIKPDGFKIPKQASDVHGITTERASKEGIELESALDQFIWALKESEHLVAHNIRFDEKIIGAELVRKGFNHALMNKNKICTMLASTKYCEIPGRYGFKWPTLTELHEKLFEEDFPDAHNALVDVEAMVRCFFELKKRKVL
ncbi:3'-5' exonuclease [Candidatus Parcubacteria bacterium]|nr:MAG: 3'-5' exonuclease [Candidatus Parcubacteria bacterium]